MLYLKYYKVTVAPYRPGALPVDTLERRLVAQTAEHHLRGLLAAGRDPGDVELVAIERATPAQIGPDGAVRDTWAWDARALEDPDREAVISAFTAGGAYVAGVIEAADEDVIPDPASEEFRAAGSVLVRRGWVRGLRVASWLRPVARALADRYGLPVRVAPGPPAFVVGAAPPVVIPAAVDEATAAALRAWHLDHHADPGWRVDADPRVSSSGLVEYTLTPPAVRETVFDLAVQAGAQLGLPVDALRELVIARYHPGSSHPWHVDLDRTRAGTFDRTLALSLLLGRPGVDFTGGALRTGRGPVELGLGDGAAFTAGTRHAVDQVAGGERFVLVAFGSWSGWPA